MKFLTGFIQRLRLFKHGGSKPAPPPLPEAEDGLEQPISPLEEPPPLDETPEAPEADAAAEAAPAPEGPAPEERVKRDYLKPVRRFLTWLGEARKADKRKLIKTAAAVTAVVLLAVCGIAVWKIFFSGGVYGFSDEYALSRVDVALFQAVRDGNTEEVLRCLSEGGNPDAVDKLRRTPFRTAIALNRVDAVREFIKAAHGDLSNNPDGAGKWDSLLVYAIVQNRPQIVKELAKLSPDVNALDKNGHTPLLYAINRNHVESAMELMAAGADVNARSRDGVSPLIAAVTSGKHDMVRELLKRGADFTVPSPSGETALSIARRRRQDVIVALLTEAETPAKTLTYEEYMNYTIPEENDMGDEEELRASGDSRFGYKIRHRSSFA